MSDLIVSSGYHQCEKCKLMTIVGMGTCSLCGAKMCIRCLVPHHKDHLEHFDVTKAAMRDANAVMAGENDDGD